MSIFTGSGVALVTPFLENGEIDWQAYDHLIELHLNNQTDALIITGTTGEGSTLTADEQIELIRVAVEKVDGQLPVIAGTGSNNTAYSLYLSQRAAEGGADALLLVTPYYNKANQKGMYLHFTSIASAVDLPIILYHVPSRTAATLSVEEVVELAEHPNIVAIKDASGDLDYTRALIEANIPGFAVYSGNDDLIYDVLALGGQGVISVLANVAPIETHQICQEYFEGNEEKAKSLQSDLNPLIDLLFKEVNPIPVKYLTHLLAYNQNVYRLPLYEPSDPLKEELKQALPNIEKYRFNKED